MKMNLEIFKLNEECQNCSRLVHNGGTCDGKKGRAPCLAFKPK